MDNLELQKPIRSYKFILDEEMIIKKRIIYDVLASSRKEATDKMKENFDNPKKYKLNIYDEEQIGHKRTINDNERNGRVTKELFFYDSNQLIKNNEIKNTENETLVYSGYTSRTQESSKRNDKMDELTEL